jgi:two-component system CheB/CheR fusion protein
LIAVTGYGQEQDRARSRDAGFVGHLVKPVDLKEVHNVVEATSVGGGVSSAEALR